MLRRFLTLLIASAYLGAAVLVVAPMAKAASADMSRMAMQQQDGNSDPMPCKGMPSGCVTDLGCILMVSLPARDLIADVVIAWSFVTYATSTEFSHGRALQPALGPPRSFA